MPKRMILIYVGLLGVLLLVFGFLAATQQSRQNVNVPASEFISRVENGDITRVTIAGNQIHGESKGNVGYNSYASEKEELVRVLHDKHVPYEEKESSDNSSWISLIIKVGLAVFIAFLLLKSIKSAGANNTMLKQQTAHKSKLYEQMEKKTFADVAGVDEAVEECRDFVTSLRDPTKFAKLGGRSPKGILLVGPPGNGKTLLARAIAGEAGVPFFAGSASEFVEMFVGIGASRVRDLFDHAKKHIPCIVFIDEIDAVGKKRSGHSGPGAHEEREQTLNQLLVEMDGFEPNKGILVIAATNRPETLDPALTRSGRLDRTVVVPPPDVRGREAILRVHARDKKMAPQVNYTAVALGTAGLVGADLEKLLNEAAIDAAKRGQNEISTEDIERAKEKVFMGPERKSAVLSAKTKEIIAWHEAGHAIVGWFTAEAHTPHRVTIIPRGMALGLTWFLPSEDVVLRSRKELLADIKVAFGGRAAEKLLLKDDYTTGASNDLERASEIAERMVKNFGMGNGLGFGTFAKKEQGYGFDPSKGFSEETAVRIDAEQKRILEECESRVLTMLTAKLDLLKQLAETLLIEETIGVERLTAILGPRPVA